jgi:hypothetical protein
MTCGFKVPVGWPDGCPEEPHEELPGTYFRFFHDANKPTPEEMMTGFQLGQTSGSRKARCLDCAYSVLDSVEHAQNFLVQFPLHGRKDLGSFALPPGHGGVIHRDSDSRKAGHLFWWLPEGRSPSEYYGGPARECQ